MDSTTKIRALNDEFRTQGRGNGLVYLTAGIYRFALLEQRIEILQRVRSFAVFTRGNDPYGEHDYGSFEYAGKKILWKIDLYEEPNVKDANGEPVVTRVLTIMLANEY